jgi:hypothetical protein
MNDLLQLAVDAHGGLARWDQLKRIKASVSITGAVWQVKGRPDVLTDVSIEAELHQERLTTHFNGQGKRTVFEPNRITIETETGQVLESRGDPRSAFRGLARINLKAGIVLCGSISKTNPSEPGPANYFNLVARRGRMEGFTGLDYGPRFHEAIEALGRWQQEGKLVQKGRRSEGSRECTTGVDAPVCRGEFREATSEIADVNHSEL